MKFSLPLAILSVALIAGCSGDRYPVPDLPSSLSSPASVIAKEKEMSANSGAARVGLLDHYNPFERSHKDFAQVFYFATGEAELSRGDLEELSALVDRSEGFSDYRFVVSGHTDRHGREAANDELSRLRAAAVVDYLVYRSVPYGKITIQSKSEREPAVLGFSKYGDAMNRRVEVQLHYVPSNGK